MNPAERYENRILGGDISGNVLPQHHVAIVKRTRGVVWHNVKSRVPELTTEVLRRVMKGFAYAAATLACL